MIKNEKLVKKVEEDTTINVDNILNDIERQPYNLNKYQKRLNVVLTQLRKTRADYEELYSERYKYYKETYDPILQSSTDIKAYTNGDSEVIKKQKEIADYESNVDFLKDAIETIKHKYFSMKLHLDYKTYLNGE